MNLDVIIQILELLNTSQEGQITLPFGVHEKEVVTNKPPVRAWISIEDENLNVCQSDLSMFSTVVTPDGFILYADVRSEEATINWKVDFDSSSVM